jgi:peptide/nickel transport system permease protein
MARGMKAAVDALASRGFGWRAQRYTKAFTRFVSRKPLGALGLFLVFAFVVLGLLAGVGERRIIATHDPLAQDPLARLKPPGGAHWLGTDEFGRDVYSRIVYGARVSLMVALFAIGIGTTLGLLLGVVSGYLGGWVDLLLQRLSEIILSFPAVLLALAMVAMLGAGLDKVVIALSIVFFPTALRVIRGSTLSVKQNVYIEAAQAIGATRLRIMGLHVLPNVMAPFLIVASVQLGSAILLESTLSFLGLGVPPPHPSWGRMLTGGAQQFAQTAPWLVVFPGAAITLMVLGFNLFGDALRDVLDPKLRGR